MYDSRTGRRFENDPITYEWQSTYATFNNNPVYFADPYGLEGEGGDGSGNGDDGKSGSKDAGKNNSEKSKKPDASTQAEIDRQNKIMGPNSEWEAAYDPNTGGIVTRRKGSGNSDPNAKTNPENTPGSNTAPPENKNKNPEPETVCNPEPSKMTKVVTKVSNIASGIGIIRDLYDEKLFKPNYYKIKEGNNIYKWIDGTKNGVWWKRNPMLFQENKVVYNHPKVISKISRGKFLARTGVFLNYAGLAFSAYQVYDDIKTKGKIQVSTYVDLTMSGVAFVPGVGWIISGSYFILKSAGVFDSPSGPTLPKMYHVNFMNGSFIMPRDNTRVVKTIFK